MTAGTILYHTLIRLGHPPDKIMVHLLQKGTNIHSDTERERLIGAQPQRLIVLDQGSRPGRAIIPPSPGISGKTTLIIDHHMSEKARGLRCLANFSGPMILLFSRLATRRRLQRHLCWFTCS